MDRKYIILIAAVVVIVVVAVAAAYALGAFNETTDFDNKIMSGSFQGEVSQQKIPSNQSNHGFSASYKDKSNGIEYNMSSLDNVSIIIDIMALQSGMANPETREYNDVNWTIYYSQAVPNTNVSNSSNSSQVLQNTYDVYILEAYKDNQSYLVYVVSNGTVKCDGSTYCDLYTKHIEPFLESVDLKHSSNVPKVNDTLGISQETYKQLVQYVNAYKSGNITQNGTAVQQ